jgi:outer membrane lipoprotein LolB
MLMRVVILMMSLLLAACAFVPAPPTKQMPTPQWLERQAKLEKITSWHINGALAIRSADHQSLNANYDWRQQGSHYQFTLAGAKSTAELFSANNHAKIISQKHRHPIHASADANSLLSAELGWHLPMASLQYWIRGLPAPHSHANKQFSQYHRLIRLVQENWLITYHDFVRVNGIDLPQHITLESGDNKIKLLIQHWQF